MLRQYSETFTVQAMDCDVRRRMRPAALFVAMQEGGERHAVSLGAGYDAMMARGLFFALTRVHVHFFRAPRCGERIVHTTWPGTSNRFFCPRYHIFSLEDGTQLAAAASLWVMLDARERRIVSPATVDLHFPDTSDLPAPIDLPTRMPRPGEASETFTRMPLYSDYDVNGHVNNTRYIGYLCDALGHDVMKDHYLLELTAGYEKEIREPHPLKLSLSLKDEAFTFLIAAEGGEKHFIAGGTLQKESEP